MAVLGDIRQAEDFAAQLAVHMIEAEIVVPPLKAVSYEHNQPVIRCQRARDPMPADLDAVVLPGSAYTTLNLVNVFSPLLGQHTDRAAQTAIVVPEAIAPDADTRCCTLCHHALYRSGTVGPRPPTSVESRAASPASSGLS
ncbi:hypothetical protein [Streptomyces sp. NBC_01320]|uniref:hypothetical protein n=1 Tax=Streptomyces sp. NBC_01320 TaxID=2903824 RepID=UPI002E166C60|nr:hypothetical protein OG395_57080 [Streptomyces sp. NBC_01320]